MVDPGDPPYVPAGPTGTALASLAMAFKDMHLPWLLHTGLPGHTAENELSRVGVEWEKGGGR